MDRRHGFFHFLVTPSPDVRGVLVLLSIGVLTNIMATLLGLVFGTAAWLWGLTILSIVLLLVAVWGIDRLQRRPPPLVLVAENDRPTKHHGLIVLIGTGRPDEDVEHQSAWASITYHLPEDKEDGLRICWLVASAGEGGSIGYAQQLEARCEALKITAHTCAVADAYSVQSTYEVIRRIYEQEVPAAGLTESEVIADITGGTTPMSAGMALACGNRRPMQYMYGRKKGIATIPRQMRFAQWGRS